MVISGSKKGGEVMDCQSLMCQQPSGGLGTVGHHGVDKTSAKRLRGGRGEMQWV